MYCPRIFCDLDARTEHILFYTEERATTVASVPEATIGNTFFTLVLNDHVCLLNLFISRPACRAFNAVSARSVSGEGAIHLQAAICFRVVQPRLTTRSDGAQPHGSRLIVGGWRKPAAWL